MNDLKKYCNRVGTVDREVVSAVRKRLDSQTKPQGSLGTLEELVIEISAIQRTDRPVCDRKVIFTLAADHGIAREGVSAYPQSVTAQMVQNFVNGGAGVNVLARHAGCDVVVVDIGVASDLDFSGFIARKIDYGTGSFIHGPAMSREQALTSIVTGIELALEREFDILGTGEMGIGNTTASAAVAAVLTGENLRDITGRGTGIDEGTLEKKVELIEKGIERNQPDPSDPVGVLAGVGGFEIGGIAGLVIGAAIKRKPAVVDGYISTVGAMVACALCSNVRDYILLSHRSAEKGHEIFAEYLGKKPILDLGLRLGEGTGAALAMEIVDAALALYYNMATFDQAGVDGKL